MKYIIPFLYNHLPDGIAQAQEPFQLNTINIGITLCRRLNLEPYAIILGKKESEEINFWSINTINWDSPLIKTGELITEILGLKVKRNHEPYYLAFQCTERDYNKENEKIQEIFKKSEEITTKYGKST